MKCGNCKHWQEWYGREKVVKRCERIEMFWNATDWSVDGDKRIFLDDSKAFVQDGSDYSAYLLTKEDFYCNMWEAL